MFFEELPNCEDGIVRYIPMNTMKMHPAGFCFQQLNQPNPNMKRVICLWCIAISLTFAKQLQAATVTWSGASGTDTNWSNTAM
jgi:hypothetical protein